MYSERRRIVKAKTLQLLPLPPRIKHTTQTLYYQFSTFRYIPVPSRETPVHVHTIHTFQYRPCCRLTCQGHAGISVSDRRLILPVPRLAPPASGNTTSPLRTQHYGALTAALQKTPTAFLPQRGQKHSTA